jgi:SAM-dependent methyltransferase
VNTLSPSDLAKCYHVRFEALGHYRDAVWTVLARECFDRYVPEGGTVLDLGSGWGEFIRHVKAGRRIAMDANPELPLHVGEGVEVAVQDCSETWRVEWQSLDVVFSSNLLEHLADRGAVRRTLEEAYRCLKPGGVLACVGPNYRYVGGAYWDFWDHSVALTDRSLAEVLRLVGFDVERVEPRFLPYSMSQGFTPLVACVALYLKLPLLWRVFGKQFLVVARRPK